MCFLRLNFCDDEVLKVLLAAESSERELVLQPGEISSDLRAETVSYK